MASLLIPDGRRNRDRTCDPCLVRALLSQLSYPPGREVLLNTRKSPFVNYVSWKGTSYNEYNKENPARCIQNS